MRARRTGSLNAEPEGRGHMFPTISSHSTCIHQMPLQKALSTLTSPGLSTDIRSSTSRPARLIRTNRTPAGFSRPLRCRCRDGRANNHPLCMTTVGVIWGLGKRRGWRILKKLISAYFHNEITFIEIYSSTAIKVVVVIRSSG